MRVYRVFEAWGTAYMVTEYVEGQTLSAALRASGPWSERQVRELLDVLTDGLSAVHGAGLLHRDIKPGNVMVRPDGTPVLIDFGSARQAMGRQSRSVTAVLTPEYAPIEQYSPRGNQGPWTDIYALGALAYEALIGQVPDDAIERVREDRLRPVDEVAPQRVSAVLAAAIDAALAVDEGARPQGLDAWRAQLAGSAGVAPVSARPRGGASVGAAAATGAVGGDVVAERSGRPAAVALAWRRWWLPGAAAVGLVGVALVVALTAPWSGRGPDVSPGQAEGPVGVAELGENVEEQAAAEQAAAEQAAAERAAAEQQRLAEERRPGRVFRDCATCPELVVVPAGTYQMGSDPRDEESEIVDQRRGLRASRPARRFLAQHSGVRPFGRPRRERHRRPRRQRRVPCGPDAYPVSLYLLTSGVQGAEPPGGIWFASGDLL